MWLWGWIYFYYCIAWWCAGFLLLWIVTGDSLITLAVQKLGSDYLSTDFQLSWSVLTGRLSLKGLELTKKTLDMINPFIPFPADVQELKLKSFKFQLPLIPLLKGPSNLFTGVEIEGFDLSLSLHSKTKWIWRNDDNKERFLEAIVQAGTARIAQANNWTASIKQKVETIAKALTPEEPKEAVEESPKKAEPASWIPIANRFADAFQIVVKENQINFMWGLEKSLGIGIGIFHIEKATDVLEQPILRDRVIRIGDFNMYLNPKVTENPIYLVPPMSMTIKIQMPSTMHVAMTPTDDERVMKLQLSLPPMVFQLRPSQINALMSFMNPVNAHFAWSARATLEDERKCVCLVDDEIETYRTAYKEQEGFNNSHNLVTAFIAKKRNKKVTERIQTLEKFEAKMLAKDILWHRVKAMEWEVPSAGEAAPHVPEEEKERADLENFVKNPITEYVVPPAVDPTFHRAEISFSLERFGLLPMDKDGKVLFEFFVSNMSMDITQSLKEAKSDDIVTDLDLKIQRFGVFDPRHSSTNIYTCILDRNPDADFVTKITTKIQGSGHMDVGVEVLSFSFLVIPEPFIVAMHAFLPALEEDESEIDFEQQLLEEEEASKNAIVDEKPVIYEKDLPAPYSPLLLKGMDLTANIAFKGWEVCLLGDPSTLKSHILALTSDVDLKIESTKRTESIVLQLEDVALQPCSVNVKDDAIDLEISGLRTILELEGEGVDLELSYQLELMPEEERQRIEREESQRHLINRASDVSGISRWQTVRSAVASPTTMTLPGEFEEKEDEARAPSSVVLGRADANRQVSILVSDVALNFSKDDVAVLLSVSSRATASLTQDVDIVKEQTEKTERIANKRKEALKAYHIKKLKKSFQSLDSDGGGTLDASEVENLLRVVLTDNLLTKDEFDESVKVFINLVDSDGSGDVSYDEFIKALDPDEVQYPTLHQGIVAVTAGEYVNPKFKRSSVPSLTTGMTGRMAQAMNATNAMSLKLFWDKYSEQTGAERTTLNGQSPLVVQQKMVRCFQSYEYAQEAWNRLVNPSLLKPMERSHWLLTRNTVIHGRGNIADKLLSSITSKPPPPPSIPSGKPMFVHTTLTTKFGGFYIRVIDVLLPIGTPSIEFACEEVDIDTNFSVWEGCGESDSSSDSSSDNESRKNAGSAAFGFTVYGRYYNSRVRQIEPFLEPYQGNLSIVKDVDSPICIQFSSDRYCHMNITAAFMDTIQADVAAFSSAQMKEEREREHIDELGGIFWLRNVTGSCINYWLVTEKEDHHKKKSTSSTSIAVMNEEYSACTPEDDNEILKAQYEQNMKEKEMRSAFRRADTDGSGELTVDEVRLVLREVLSNDNLSQHELEEYLADFMQFAVTDGSGEVSWEEFKAALAKTRDTSERTLSFKVDGFEPIDKVPIDVLGSTLVYELTPEFDPPLDDSTDIANIYEMAKLCYLKHDPSPVDISQAMHLFERVVKLDETYEWAASYLSECRKDFIPMLAAVNLTVDGDLGMVVTVSSGVELKNGTGNTTEVKLLDHDGSTATTYNPSCGYFSIPALQSINVPVDLVNEGKFSIRQVGEDDWSDPLEIWFCEQYKTAKTKIDGNERTWMLPDKTIDGQPVVITETGSATQLGTWTIAFQPQFVFENILPCTLEYAVAQASDCPEQIKSNHSLDDVELWFQHVTEINCRRGLIESGQSVQILGLELSQVAYMKFRVACPSRAPEHTSIVAWSRPFQLKVQEKRKKFDGHEFSISLPQGPNVSFQQSWTEEQPRTLMAYAPYWVHNKTGLEILYKVSKGTAVTMEQHQKYFGKDTKVPLLIGTGDARTKLSIRPVDIVPEEEDHWNQDLGVNVRKYVPDFSSTGWSSYLEVHQVGVNIEVKGSGYVLSCEVSVLPSQFRHTKVVTLYPRYVVKNRLEQALQVTPVMIDKHGLAKLSSNEDRLMAQLEKNDALIVYKFEGSAKASAAIRARDTTMTVDIDGAKMGDWMPNVPLGSNSSYDAWAQSPMGDGPLVRTTVQHIGNTIFANMTDNSKVPAFRLENRSALHSLRYIQVGVVRGEESILLPLTWHSFAWQNPLKEEPRLKIYIGNNRKPLTVDILQVFRHGKISPDGGKTALYGEVYIDGPTRVLAFSDVEKYNIDRMGDSSDLLSDLSIDVGLHGFGLTIVDSQPKEIMNITAEEIHLYSKPNSRAISFSVHHVQIDDMTPSPLYPVFFAPLDCGFNSNKSEGWKMGDPEVPFFKFLIETAPGEGIAVFNQFRIELGSMVNRINLDYLLLVANVLLRFVPEEDPSAYILNGINNKNAMLETQLSVPDVLGSGALLYFKKWVLTAFDFHLVFDSNPDKAGSGIAGLVGPTLGSILGGIAHVTPEFHFKKIAWDNKFFFVDELVYDVVMKIVFNVLGQWYKIVGSLELLGDPVGLAADISSGFALAVRQTKRDISGQSEKKGQGAVTLVQAAIGAPMGALGKSTNAMGDVLKKATYFEDQEDEMQPRHIGSGLVQGGVLMGKSLVYGVTGLVTKPYEGAKEDGVKGFTKGVGKGAVRLVASPFVGVLGAVEKFSTSVNNTTHLGDPVYFEGTRRPARELKSQALKTLPESNIMTEMEVHILKVTGLHDISSTKVYTTLLTPHSEESEHNDRVLDYFKTSTKRHSKDPEFNESRLFDVQSTGMRLRFEVYHKRSPLPKKLLGSLELSVEEIYKTYDSISAEILGENKVRTALLSKKRHHGSVFEQCIAEGVCISGSSVELVDGGDLLVPESTRSNVSTISLSNSKKKLEFTPAEIHVCPLTLPSGHSTSAKLHLSIRYVNDMRR